MRSLLCALAAAACVAAAGASPAVPQYGSTNQHLKGFISLPYGSLIEPFETWVDFS